MLQLSDPSTRGKVHRLPSILGSSKRSRHEGRSSPGETRRAGRMPRLVSTSNPRLVSSALHHTSRAFDTVSPFAAVGFHSRPEVSRLLALGADREGRVDSDPTCRRPLCYLRIGGCIRCLPFLRYSSLLETEQCSISSCEPSTGNRRIFDLQL